MTCKDREKIGYEDGKNETDVGGNVGGHITTLGLNDGKGSKRSTTELVVHLGGTLKKTRVEVEDTVLLLVG